jgi:hypothetical protein
MEDREIGLLRLAVMKATEDGGQVIWFDADGRCSAVIAVPYQKMDPDRTGIDDFVALLGHGSTVTGHVDLSNAESGTFSMAHPVFETAPASTPHF